MMLPIGGGVRLQLQLRLFFSLSLMILYTLNLTAQEEQRKVPLQHSPLSGGIFGGGTFNAYAGELNIGDDPRLGGGACGLVGGGTGNRLAIGAFGEYLISPKLSFGMRGVVENRSGAMTADLLGTEFRLPSGDLQTVESEHRFEIDLRVVSLEPYVLFAPLDIPLRFTVGPKIGFTSNPTYEFAEELGVDDQSEISFSNGTKRQVYASGQVGRSVLFGLAAGVGYELPIANGLYLIPELTFSSYFNSPLPGESAPIVAGGRPSIALRYAFAQPAPDPPILPPLEPTVPPAPPEAPEPELVASVQGYGIDPSGQSVKNVIVEVEERVRRREIALLPYIFFAENSAEIPARYTDGRGKDGETIVAKYRNLLDLLGERMRAESKLNVRLIGTNADDGEEKGNVELSRKRAESVGNYLKERWGVDPSRIKVEGRNLPERPSNPTLPGGREENRRVEIVADQSLLNPMIVEDTIRTYSSPGLRFELSAPSEAKPTAYQLRVMVGKESNVTEGGGVPRGVVEQKLSTEEVASIASGTPISYTLTIQNESGKSYTTERGVLNAEVKRIRREDMLLDDRSVSISTPILFPYNSVELSREDREVLARFKNSLPEGAKLTITGYADDLGETGYNRTLSGRRAEAVAKLFEGFPVTIVAAGEEGTIGGENTPEGRFYARTVTIEVER
ncbi:MAG: OmpA family protein [Candidatus Kapaibacterium sp.]